MSSAAVLIGTLRVNAQQSHKRTFADDVNPDQMQLSLNTGLFKENKNTTRGANAGLLLLSGNSKSEKGENSK